MAHMGTTAPWATEDVRFLAGARELQIAVPHADGRPGAWTPIWVVVVEDEVFVRTWQRRSTGWYGRAVHAARARIRVADRSVDVIVAGTGDADQDAVDSAYRAKYGAAGARSMVTAEAAASTLRLSRASTAGSTAR
jgi:hypothetical protein